MKAKSKKAKRSVTKAKTPATKAKAKKPVKRTVSSKRKVVKKATPKKRVRKSTPKPMPIPRSPRAAFEAGMERQRQLDEMIKEQLANEPAPPRPIRAETLDTARDLTVGDRNDSYGDPLDNFQMASALKGLFWAVFATHNPAANFPEPKTALRGKVHTTGYATNRDKQLGRDSAHGHAIDMILTNLARIATSPMDTPQADRYIDLAGYAALAREVAERT